MQNGGIRQFAVWGYGSIGGAEWTDTETADSFGITPDDQVDRVDLVEGVDPQLLRSQ